MQQYPYHTADEQPSVFTNGSNAVLNTVESAQTGAQHTQHKICPTCSGDTGWVIVFQGSPTIPCQCPQGKLRASA